MAESDKYQSKFGEVRADQAKPEAVTWLWPSAGNLPQDSEEYEAGRIPQGMLTLIGGRPGEGKSIVTATLAAEISNRKVERNGVLFSNMEDPIAQVIRPRLEAAGANLKNVHLLNFLLPRDPDGIEAAVESLRAMIYGLKLGLIIADPIAAHLGVSIYNDQDVRRALSPLTKMLSETNTAMVAVVHTNKHVSKNADPRAAFGGSGGGLMGAARAAFAFGKAPDDESQRLMATVKFNLGPAPSTVAFDMEEEEWVIGEGRRSKVLRTGKLVHLSWDHPATALDVLTGGKGGEGVPAEKKAIAAEWLTGYLSTGAQDVKSVRADAADQGISWATLRRAADEVGVVKQRVGVKGKRGIDHVEWRLPDGHPALAQTTVDEMIEEAEGDEEMQLTDEDIAKLLGSEDEDTEDDDGDS